MLKDIRAPITKSVIAAAQKFKIPVKNLGLLAGKILLQLGWGENIKWTRGAVTSQTSYLAMKIAHHKDFANKILAGAKIPVPKHFCGRGSDIKLAKNFLKKIKFPVVVKPSASRQGKEVHCDIMSLKEALALFKKVLKKFKKAVIEEQIEGNDFRILIIGGKMAATLQRIPPFIIGNGKSTIFQLIKKENQIKIRKTKKIYPIKIDLEVKRTLRSHKLTLKSILPKDKKLFLRRNANISTGGVGVDVTEIIHPKNVALAKRATKIVGLDICGVDLIIPDISKPYDLTGGKIVELNGGPDAAIHHYPILGKPRMAGEAIVQMLFPTK
jgi:cyanophycin synthetase